MSRCVLIPFDQRLSDLSPRQILALKKSKDTFSSCLQRILQLSEEDLLVIADTIEELKPTLIARMGRDKKLQEAVVERVSYNMAMLYGFSRKVRPFAVFSSRLIRNCKKCENPSVGDSFTWKRHC